MSVASQTFGLPLSRTGNGSFAAIGLRLWKHAVATIQARRRAAAEARAERELLSLAAAYENSMPSFAADLRAASARRIAVR
ncbi:MAG: hypothetical protein JO006_10375 [Paucibacter sp.]|nr:hypothetical protein [Roseateles sp.]